MVVNVGCSLSFFSFSFLLLLLPSGGEGRNCDRVVDRRLIIRSCPIFINFHTVGEKTVQVLPRASLPKKLGRFRLLSLGFPVENHENPAPNVINSQVVSRRFCLLKKVWLIFVQFCFTRIYLVGKCR